MNTLFHSLKFLIITCILFLIACNCKKVYYDYSTVFLDTYYSGILADGEKLYLSFNRADSLISGHFFIYSGSAIVKKHPFHGYSKKETAVLQFHFPDKTLKTKGNISTNRDTLFFTPVSSSSKKFGFILIREKTKRQALLKPRYDKIAFSKYRKKELEYGKAYGYYTSKPVASVKEDQYPAIILDVGKSLISNVLMEELPLKMDFYEPIGDTVSKRPLLILIHGGAFIIGDKSSETMTKMAEYFTLRGYVVAVINYRLGYMFVPGGYVYLERCIYRAVQDARAAIRYLIRYADNYRIDKDNIFLAGNSAGGFTALKTAYMDKADIFESVAGNTLLLQNDLGCLDCSGNSFKETFSIKGVINMWGALTDTSMIRPSENIPVLHFHGDADNIVPPGHDYPFANVGTEFSSFFSQKTYGSVAIHQHMQNIGIYSKLILFPGAGHDPQVDRNDKLNDKMTVIFKEINSFLFQILASDSFFISGKKIIQFSDKTAVYEIKDKKLAQTNWTIEGGKIIKTEKKGQRIHVVWYEGEPSHIITCSAIEENGFFWKDTMNVLLSEQ
jgi:acetyl esterase/lipase